MRPAVPIPLLKLVSSANLSSADIFGNPDVVVTGVATHAQHVERNNLFVAVSGVKTDSHMLISDAVARGASAVLTQQDTPPYPGVTMVRVPDTRWALGQVAHAFHGHPARAMTVAGVTGTNGKTTSSSLISAIMARAGRKTGLIGTLGTFWDGKYIDDHITTPGPMTLARHFAAMERDGVNFVCMEVSSHAIHQARVAGLPFHAGLLTSVSQDHLDYHGDYATYIGVKRSFFFDYVSPTPGSVSCLNFDDAVGEELCSSYDGESLGFSVNGESGQPVTARNIAFRIDGTGFDLVVNGRSVRVEARLIGGFNLTNMLGAAAVCHSLGVDLQTIAVALAEVPPISGRFERIDEGQPFLVVVDYAHTPDALEKVLRAARRLTAGELITVFGCGGDRDRTKRAPMGKMAGRHSDHVIVTSDNPRNEDPDRIARAAVEGLLQSGLKPARQSVTLDRAQAINKALAMAKPGDCVVIAGKGHETYQEICGEKFPFDDRVAARTGLRALAAGWGRQVQETETAWAESRNRIAT